MNGYLPYLERETDTADQSRGRNSPSGQSSEGKKKGQKRPDEVIVGLKKIQGSWGVHKGNVEPNVEDRIRRLRADSFYVHLVIGDSSPSKYEQLFSRLKKVREPKKLHGSDLFSDVVCTFDILPAAHHGRKYLQKAGVHNSSREALASDWKKVGKDLWTSVFTVLPELAKNK
jgi:hypothetical protein